MKTGYHYIAYSLFEAVIEDNKTAYYLALRKTQETLRSNDSDYELWFSFFIKSLEKQKERLKYKIEHRSGAEENRIKKQRVDLDDLPDVVLKIYKLFKKKDRIDFKYIKDNVDDSESKIKCNLILLQDKKLIKKYGITNGSWYSKEEMS